LNLVPVLQVHAAVASPLAKVTRHEGHVEFQVECAVADLFFGGVRPRAGLDPHAAVVVGFPVAIGPGAHVRGFARFIRKKHHGAFRRRLPLGRRMPVDLLEFERGVVRPGRFQHVLGGLGIPQARACVTMEGDAGAHKLSVKLHLVDLISFALALRHHAVQARAFSDDQAFGRNVGTPDPMKDPLILAHERVAACFGSRFGQNRQGHAAYCRDTKK